MDDETVRSCFDSDLDPMNALAEVIPSSGHRLKFITAFHNKVFGNGSTDQAKFLYKISETNEFVNEYIFSVPHSRLVALGCPHLKGTPPKS